MATFTTLWPQGTEQTNYTVTTYEKKPKPMTLNIKSQVILLGIYYWPAYTQCRGPYCFALWRLSSSVVVTL